MGDLQFCLNFTDSQSKALIGFDIVPIIYNKALLLSMRDRVCEARI